MSLTLFDVIADRLEKESNFSRLVARGTVRFALQQAGLDPLEVTPEHMRIMLERILPDELVARGLDKPQQICTKLLSELDIFASHAKLNSSSPEDFFKRIRH